METHANLSTCPKCGGLKDRRAKTCGKCAGSGYKGHGPTTMICTCEYCKKEFLVPKWREAQGRGRFCSRECVNKYQETIKGEDHPKSTGRHTTSSYSGANWKMARQAVIDRANGRCEQCGIDLSTVKRFAVHHVIGSHEFRNVEDSHTVDNLSVICQSCHAKNHNLGRMPG